MARLTRFTFFSFKLTGPSFLCLICLGWALSLPLAQAAQAAVPPKAAKAEVKSLITPDSVLRGGLSEGYMSLLDVRRSSDRKKMMERLVLDFGDSSFAPTKHVSYYTLEYKKGPPRLLLQLSLVMSTHFQAESLAKKLSGGLLVKDVHIEFDSLSQAQVLSVELKSEAKVSLAQWDGDQTRPARLVLDLQK